MSSVSGSHTIVGITRREVSQSLHGVVSWVARRAYRAYEPADGNLSFLGRFTGARILPMRVLQQLVLRAPVNIRPFIGIRPHESAIGRGYMAATYLLLASQDSGDDYRRDAIACLDWLVRHRSPSAAVGVAWGDPYDYATRGGRRQREEPLLVWTALIGHVFLDAYRALAVRQYLDVAEAAGRWMLTLPREHTPTGSCLSYSAQHPNWIHNANALGASFLARLASMTENDIALRVATDAMAYTCARQRPDGAWYYAEDVRFRWIDNFHTAYVLSALKDYRDATGDESVDEPLGKGRRFYTAHFFERDGRPRYHHDRTSPIDIQCAAQAIETLATVAPDDPRDLELAGRVALWTITNMQNPDGHFDYRRLGPWRVRTPMLHWGQASMAKALAVLLGRMDTATSLSGPETPPAELTTHAE